MRKVIVHLTVKLVIVANEGQSIDEVIQEMDYNFTADPDINADIADTEILDYEIIDSK